MLDRVYERADLFAWPEPGVLAQYRSTECDGSAHLKVRSNWSFIVDHIDDANPSCSPAHAVRHAAEAARAGSPAPWVVAGLLAVAIIAVASS